MRHNDHKSEMVKRKHLLTVPSRDATRSNHYTIHPRGKCEVKVSIGAGMVTVPCRSLKTGKMVEELDKGDLYELHGIFSGLEVHGPSTLVCGVA